jgi:hypothetical protein
LVGVVLHGRLSVDEDNVIRGGGVNRHLAVGSCVVVSFAGLYCGLPMLGRKKWYPKGDLEETKGRRGEIVECGGVGKKVLGWCRLGCRRSAL